ncbi:regulatory protein RecX [Brachybacterium sp. FME24]|uniref:regulatory protein RecX n=1 Tax=Brachybacterium sp. FME24 TaxID=2742605 RepID=UPI001D02577C|nr:regulatory protein RecX [Brachybacterium sp. FME24]
MADHLPAGSGRDDHEIAAAAPVSLAHIPTAPEIRADLSQRTHEILNSPPTAADPLSAEREKAVVHECRYLMRLLSTRRRSAGEMRQRLEKREVPADVAHETMARIDRAGLIDDAAFARDWVQQRRELRALGDEALRRELHKRWVAAPLIDAALIAGESDEESRCRALVRSRIGYRDREQLSTERDGSHRRRLSRRLDALLTRKGYPGSLAVHVIAGELREAASSPER